MVRRTRPGTIAVLLVAALSCLGCLSRGGGEPGAAPNGAQDRWTLDVGEARSLAGCRYDYRVFAPDGASRMTGTTVLLAHGFLRDQDTLVGLARALVGAGHRVITLELCNMRLWNGHHRRNAADMTALAERVAPATSRVYAGFSAGALAALLAGADDPLAIGVLTLDLVDQAGLGERAARRIASAGGPTVEAIAGPPSACNAGGNASSALAALGIEQTVIAGASHCEFESPTDWLCELACGDETPLPTEPAARAAAPTDRESDERERRHIIELAVQRVDELARAASCTSCRAHTAASS